MNVAVVGLGALGQVYGVRLALRASCQVTYVVRPARAAAPVAPLLLTRIDGDEAEEQVDHPALATAVPGDTEVVLVCVRAEQLGEELDALLRAVPDVPIVSLTPVLPDELERLTATHGPRFRVAMPGVVAYFAPSGRCRYWLPKVAPTLIDGEPPVPPAITALAQALDVAGFGGRIQPGVRETNPATTLAFVPLTMGIDAAGGIDALLANRTLLRVTLDAAAEGLALAACVGKTPGWVDVLARFAGPTSLKVGIALVRRRSPEALHYVEEHFGAKLHAQNVAMARAIVQLAKARGVPHGALERLQQHLDRPS